MSSPTLSPPAPPSSSRRWSVLGLSLGLAVSAGAVGWLATQVDGRSLASAFGQLSPGWIPVLIGIYLAGFLVRGWRWQLMLRPVKRIPFWTSTGIVIVGYMANNLLPARMGELVRAAALARRERVSGVTAFSSIAVERIFDGLALLGIFAVSARFGTFLPEHQALVDGVEKMATLVFCGAAAGVVVARLRPAWALALVALCARPFPSFLGDRLLGFTRRALDAIAFLEADARLPLFLGLSCLVWLVEGAMYWAALQAFHLDPDPVVAYFTLGFANFGILVPSAPGYVGLFQTCMVLSFGAMGLSESVALSYSVVLHACQFFPITLLGLAILPRLGYSLASLGRLEGPDRSTS